MFKLILKTVGTGSVSEPVSIPEDDSFKALGGRLQNAMKLSSGKRSLAIREVDAGSTNAEEQELTALSNAYYDLERFGLHFVASPRHADVLMVTGAVSRNMKAALLKTYEATPEPKIVIAVGDDAIDGGAFKGSYAIEGGVKDVIPVDFEIPGDPPSPKVVLAHLVRIMESLGRAPHR
ncbi:MAG: hydrogenase [Patescibacteria group bacterium]|nr:hydrogenase [Patescibacteria group bacterium]